MRTMRHGGFARYGAVLLFVSAGCGGEILSPADDREMAGAMALALAAEGPVYVRMGKADLGRVHTGEVELAWGRMIQVRGWRERTNR